MADVLAVAAVIDRVGRANRRWQVLTLRIVIHRSAGIEATRLCVVGPGQIIDGPDDTNPGTRKAKPALADLVPGVGLGRPTSEDLWMALFPCAVGLHRYAGPQRSAYLGVANGGLSARSKLRLCREHFQVLKEFCDEQLTLICVGETETGNDQLDDGRCGRHPELLGEYQAYATLYPLRDEALIYFARLCQDDSDAFRRVGQIELA